jgi:hypothetical protein
VSYESIQASNGVVAHLEEEAEKAVSSKATSEERQEAEEEEEDEGFEDDDSEDDDVRVFAMRFSVRSLTCHSRIGYRNYHGASRSLAGLQVSIIVHSLQTSRPDHPSRALYPDHKPGSLQADLHNPLYPKHPKVDSYLLKLRY